MQLNLSASKIGTSLILLWVFSLPLSTAVANVSFLLIILAWFLVQNKNKWQAFSNNHAMQAVLLFGLLSFVSIIYTSADYDRAKELSVDCLRLISIGMLVYFFQDQKIRQKAQVVFVIAMMITAIAGMLKLYIGLPIGLKYVAGAVFKHHIITSFFMATAAFLLMSWLFHYKQYRKWCIVGLIITLYYLLFMNVGRAGLLALCLYSLFFVFTHYAGKKLWLSVGCGVMVFSLALTFSPYASSRIKLLSQDWQIYHQGGSLIHSSLGSRIEFARNGLELVSQKPLLGHGLGAFEHAYTQNFANKTSLLTSHPHNELIRVTVELGVVGLLLLLGIFVSFWRQANQLSRQEKIIFRGFLATFFVGCLFNSWLMDFTELSLFCFFSACYLAITIAFQAKQYENDLAVSVIVTTYNWPQALDRVLAHLDKQNYQNFEIVVADDGSRDDTAAVVAKWQQLSCRQIKHVWQQDDGFQAGKIRNKAVAQSKGSYLIFIDGDCLTLPYFVQRHVMLAQKGCFVAGNRILLNERFSQATLNQQDLLPQSWQYWIKQRILGHCNRIMPLFYWPSNLARNWFATKWQGVKTCNLGMWRQDFIQVNGFDERYQGWGLEDSDLAIRLLKLGVSKKSAKFALPVLHLHHQEQPRTHLERNHQMLQKILSSTNFYTSCGIAQYLK